MLGITVKEALCLPSMADAVLIGGEAGLERIIQSVNIMEVPDIEAFIQPAELLVTTAYPIRDNLNALENLIPELNSRQLAALAIKPHRYISEIPAFMIDQANQLGFPLIQLPQHASFNEIINPILTEILNQQAAILARNEQISKELINIMLHGGGLDEIARTLASLLGLPVSIHGPAFKRMASWLTPRDFGPENNRLLSEIVSDQKRLLNAAKQKVPWSLYGENGGCDAHCLPVAVAGETYGYLFIWEPEKPLSERELTSVEHAVTVIALEISKKRAVFEVEARFKSNFIGALVDGEINTSEEAVTRAEKFGWQISEGFSALLFEMPGLHVKDSVLAVK
ncbi:MAG: PucR family transcriptional regulator ligand-binding domain-containing protein [Bacillota bacterium]